MPTTEEEFVIRVYYHYLFKLTNAVFGNSPYPGVVSQGYEKWVSQAGKARNVQEARNKFMKLTNSFLDADGNVQWGGMGPIMSNGSTHISHAVSNPYQL